MVSLSLLHTVLVDEGGVRVVEDNIIEIEGSCKKSLKSVDSVRKGLSRGLLKPLESVHSRGEAEDMNTEMISSQMVVFPL